MVYTVELWVRKISGIYGEESHDTQVEYRALSEEHANAVVDELLAHRATGVKSAHVLFLEDSFDCVIRQNSSGVIRIKKVTTKYIRNEGGLFSVKRR